MRRKVDVFFGAELDDGTAGNGADADDGDGIGEGSFASLALGVGC